MKVFDNIIPKKQQEEIKKFIYERNFPWYFTADISYDSNKHQARPGHFHNFVKEGKIKYPVFSITADIRELDRLVMTIAKKYEKSNT